MPAGEACLACPGGSPSLDHKTEGKACGGIRIPQPDVSSRRLQCCISGM